MNLLSNALKFTLKGVIKVKFDLSDYDENVPKDITKRQSKVSKEEDLNLALEKQKTLKKKLLIEIEDTGIGIKQTDLSKLFKYFGRLKDSQHINRKGTGLGLNITRKIVQSMNGEIKIESEYRKGTKFSMYVIIEVENEKYKPVVD